MSWHDMPQSQQSLRPSWTLGGRTPSIEDIPKLQYTAQVVKESMRVYPPVWVVGRQTSVKPAWVAIKSQRGLHLLASMGSSSAPKILGQPELLTRVDLHQINRHQTVLYMPFNRGQRQCIGDRFAEMELILVLATLAQHYRFHLDPDHVVELEPSVTLRPKNGLPMRITRHRP